MKAIILAAGRGSRMGDLSCKLPKCMTVLFNKQLIEWQFLSLNHKAISEIAIVTGYLKNKFKYKKKYFVNNNWENSNMVSSLLTANDWLRNDTCIISYSDIIYEKKIIDQLVKSKGDIVITYDPNWLSLWKLRFEDPLIDAENFSIKNGILKNIGGKSKKLSSIKGQYMGLMKFSKAGWNKIESFLNKLKKNEIDKIDMTQLFKKLLMQDFIINCIAIDGKWLEVDTKSDLINYQSNYDKTFISDLV